MIELHTYNSAVDGNHVKLPDKGKTGKNEGCRQPHDLPAWTTPSAQLKSSVDNSLVYDFLNMFQEFVD